MCTVLLTAPTCTTITAQETLDKVDHEQWRTLLYVMAVLHSIVQEQRQCFFQFEQTGHGHDCSGLIGFAEVPWSVGSRDGLQRVAEGSRPSRNFPRHRGIYPGAPEVRRHRLVHTIRVQQRGPRRLAALPGDALGRSLLLVCVCVASEGSRAICCFGVCAMIVRERTQSVRKPWS